MAIACLIFDHLPAFGSTAGGRALDAAGDPSAREFNRTDPSPNRANLQKSLRVITKTPHPMGSPEQQRLARWMLGLLRAWGWKSEEQTFTVKVPFGISAAKGLVQRTGRNVIGWRAGIDPCVYIVGGHYDSKFFPQGVHFVGANDGGSSTALMLELSRLWTHPEHALKAGQKSAGRWLDCDVVLAFFDGEEAFLPDWVDGEKYFGMRDNLYGSREFVNRLERRAAALLWKKKPVRLFLNLDMVGHKNQNLFITEGSDSILSEQFISLRGTVPLKQVPLTVEDDHVPFRKLGIPFIHIIDWTNLQEWHTPQDNLDIVSPEKIADLAQVVMKFSERKRP
jgi:hypothetical protein